MGPATSRFCGNQARRLPSELGPLDDLGGRGGGGFTCGHSRGKEEEGSSWPAEAGSGCKAGVAEREGTSRSRRCMEVEDLNSRQK